jgi:hypothetical protein
VARARLIAGLAVLLACPLPAPAQAAQQAPALPAAPGNGGGAPGTPPSAQPWQPRTTAELQALDKIDNRLATLNVPVGQSIQFEQLTITVQACVVRQPDQPVDAASYLQIVDARAGEPSFRGWMLMAEPSASVLQHPDFDVRLVACH